MSRATLLKVFKSKAFWEKELHNSSGGALLLWDYIYRVHIKHESLDPENRHIDREKELLKIDNLVKDKQVPLHHRVALFFTFDRAVILTKHISLTEPLMHKIAGEMTGYCSAKGYVNHWPTIADWFTELAKEKVDKRMIGVALNATSVADVWDDYPKLLRGDSPILYTSGDLEL